MQGEACMRCSGGQTCAVGLCLGGNPHANPGSEGGGHGNGGALATSALWWREGEFVLQRYLPQPQQQTSFHFHAPVVLWEASPNGKRWAAGLATSATHYEVWHAEGDKTRLLHTGSGVLQKLAFAENSQGLAFLVASGPTQGPLQGQLWVSLHAKESPRKLSVEACGMVDSSFHVVDFAFSPDSARLAVRAFVNEGERRAGIWLVTTAEPGTCIAVVYPGEAMEPTPGWGALGPLQWGDNRTLYFRAHLTYDYPLQLYAFRLEGNSGSGLRNPLLSTSTHSLLSFALSPSMPLVALLQENAAFSLLPLGLPLRPSLVTGCETSTLAAAGSMHFSPKNDWLLLVGEARLQLVHLGHRACHPGEVPAALEAVWSPDGNFLATLSRREEADGNATWYIFLHPNNGHTLLQPTLISMGFQHLHQLRWTSF